MALQATTLHSTIVGGSTAGRLLACPGSYRATVSLPETARVESAYAAEGTFCHEVMADLMRRRQGSDLADPTPYLLTYLRSSIGQTYADRELTVEHIEELIEPALAALEALEQEYAGVFRVIGVEQSVTFPGVPGAYGTVDLILQSARHVLHVDWKFGSGVGIKAIYSDPAGDTVNPQLMFYAAAAYYSRRKNYTGRQLAVAIIQPRGDDPLTHTLVTRRELEFFVEDIHHSIVAALDREPPLNKGEHCRFAPCKTTCPLWTGPLLDLSALKPPVKLPAEPTPHGKATPYGRYLAQAKALADLAMMFKATLDEQLHAYLQQGGTVPGWRLKAKTKQRQWIDPKTVAAELSKLGFADGEIWQDKLQTFASTDATAKRLKVKIPDELRVAPPTNETTIARDSDPAPVVEPVVLLEQFQASLRQLRDEQKTAKAIT